MFISSKKERRYSSSNRTRTSVLGTSELVCNEITLHRRRKIYLFIYDVIVKQKKRKRSANHSRDQWDGKRDAGGISEDHDRCFSMLVLGAFSTGVFQTPMNYPALTLVPMCLRIERHDRCLLMLVLVYFAHRMGSV